MLVEGGASAYFFERPEENRAYQISGGAAGSIPAFGTGTLGYRSEHHRSRRLEQRQLPVRRQRLPARGGRPLTKRDPFTNRAPVAVRLIPLIDDLAIQAVDGSLLRRSRPALFQGLGRRPLAGDRWRPLWRERGSFRIGPVRLVPARAMPVGGLREPGHAGVRVPLLGSGHRGLREAGPDLHEPPQAVAGRRRQADQRLAVGPLLRVQRGRHDGHRARRRPVVRPAGAGPAGQRAAALWDASPAAGPLPPRRCDGVTPAPARGAAGRQRPARLLRPAAASCGPGPQPPDHRGQADRADRPLHPARRAARVPAPHSAAGPRRRCCGRARRAAASGAPSRSKREEEVAPEEMQAATRFHHEDQGFPAGYLLGALVLAALAGSTIFGGPRPRTRVQPAPAYARQARQTQRRL